LLVRLTYVGAVSNPHQLQPKYFVKISPKISVSKFWNIGIGGQSNIGSWTNIGKKIFENIGIGFKKMILIGLYFIVTNKEQLSTSCMSFVVDQRDAIHGFHFADRRLSQLSKLLKSHFFKLKTNIKTKTRQFF